MLLMNLMGIFLDSKKKNLSKGNENYYAVLIY